VTDTVAIPLTQLVLKVHSRCDLACDHCYVYEHADQSWKSRPVVISEDTVRRTAHRLAQYARANGLTSVSVILHGGEPLLAGPARLRAICAQLSSALAGTTALDLQIHTNGVQLSRRHLEVFKEFGVRVGVSLDGDRSANDLHRLDRRGNSSHDRVLRAIDLLRTPEYHHLYVGLLCTVDVRSDPVAVHDALTACEPPRIDYLLPHSTWDNPPPQGPSSSATPYAEWLLAVFDRWSEQGRKVPVRTFASVLSTLRGGPSLTEALGLAPSDLAVVETDGTFEQADSLKTAHDGAPATGYDVFRHGFDDFARHPGVRARQSGAEGLSATCRSCPVLQSCGGGLYAHRYSSGRGFDNPSVFCRDLRALVEGIAERETRRELSPAVSDAGELRFAQLRQDRDLLGLANERLAGDPDWDGVWGALLRLDGDEDTAGHLNAALAHPYLRPALHNGASARRVTARFASVALTAALRAGAPLRLSWEHPEAALHLPALGTLSLPGPGRIRAAVAADGLTVRVAPGPDGLIRGDGPAWRPLTTVELGGDTLVVDDADPDRDTFPAPVAAPLSPDALAAFAALLRTAHDLLDRSGPRDGPHALRVTTVSPLVAGTGVRLGAHRPGALGVAVDVEPADLARELLRAGRHARLAALREVTDLSVLGSTAGRLLEEAFLELGEADLPGRPAAARARALRRAGDALEELSGPPGRYLTDSGAALAADLRAHWSAEVRRDG
jgi:uncharacterized protein